MFSRNKAERIAAEHLKRMNPTNWNGKGKTPKEFDTRICTYDIDSINNNELDISFEYLDEDENDAMFGWTHYCELRKKETGDLMIPLHGYGIDSLENLTDTIMDICRDEN